ncbi:MAG: response regulator [Treponema sp.]|jgi:signal transduction histidine kinase/CheY-like chemotaxis protein/HPt (histidine-containing phosphotransfer) domain-containing protein|nr:response regulator [Treponema sp.]
MKSIKKRIVNFFINVGTSGKFKSTVELIMSDDIMRHIAMNCIIFFGFFILAAFAVKNFMREVYTDAAACAVMALICVISFVLSRTKAPQYVPAGLVFISYGLMCIVLITIGEASGANFLFIFVFPLFTFMHFGMRGGIIASTIFVIIVSFVMFVPGISRYNYHFDVSIRMLAVYILVFFMISVMEVTRNKKDRMIKTQNEWLQKLRRETETANRTLEIAVQMRTIELEKQTEIAIQASMAKSRFLARMSHEIRTPLNAVIGLSEIELQGNLPEKNRNNIRQIHQSGSVLLGIINNILDISKIEAGSFDLVPVEYDAASLISDAVNLGRIRIGSNPIDFALEIDGDFPKRLFGDEVCVRQILNNVLSNAIKYTNKGSVTLNVSWKKSLHEKELQIRFLVSDTGRGIRKEDKEKLFADYAQFDTKENREVEGTGLGLVITKNLVEMMGGSVNVESEYGKGSVFTIEFLQGYVDSQSIGGETAEDLRKFRYVSSTREKDIDRSWMPYGKVLVVDDMPVNLRVAKGLLKPYGLEIDTAESGKEAIEKVRNKKYDLIFMDHMMPEMDGIEAVRIIRKLEYEEGKEFTPIVALTANALAGSMEMFLSKGFNGFLAKPIDLLLLDEILNQWVRDEQSMETLQQAENEKNRRKEAVETPGDILRPQTPGSALFNIPGLDAEYGIKITGGSIEQYREVLTVFLGEAKNRLPVLQTTPDADNLHLFVIQIHALKSALASIGAGISAEAAKLEAAGKAGDMAFVQENHSIFAQHLAELIKNLSACLSLC